MAKNAVCHEQVVLLSANLRFQIVATFRTSLQEVQYMELIRNVVHHALVTLSTFVAMETDLRCTIGLER